MATDESELSAVLREITDTWDPQDKLDTALIDWWVSIAVRAIVVPNTYTKFIAGAMLKAVADNGPESQEYVQNLLDLAKQNVAAAEVKMVSQEGARQYIQVLKEQGVEVGLMHGKHRFLEINQIPPLIVAAQQAHLVLAIDSSEMITQQGKKVLLDDETRWRLYASLPMTDVVFVNYGSVTDDFFEGLVDELRPTVYFSNEEYSKERQDERRRRADRVGARLVTLKHYGGLGHTSKFEKILTRSEADWDRLLGR